MPNIASGGVGQGVTLSLSVDIVIGRVRNVQLPEFLSPEVDFSGLDNDTWLSFIAGSLQDPGQFVAEVYLLTSAALPTINAVQEATFTVPAQGGGADATLVGSGFVTGVGMPNAAIAEPLIQTITFKYDGVTVFPAWTVEV